jgi:hypothetical protein
MIYPQETDRPQQFKDREDDLHAERERVREMALDWRPHPPPDIRDLRSPQLLGETLLRMQPSFGLCSERQDLLEAYGIYTKGWGWHNPDLHQAI